MMVLRYFFIYLKSKSYDFDFHMNLYNNQDGFHDHSGDNGVNINMQNNVVFYLCFNEPKAIYTPNVTCTPIGF